MCVDGPACGCTDVRANMSNDAPHYLKKTHSLKESSREGHQKSDDIDIHS